MHQVHSALHPGHVREVQEDGLFVDATRGLFVVIDGMGGSYSGTDAVAFIQDHFGEAVLDEDDPLSSLRGCLETVSARWWQVTQEDRRQQGSGATIAAAWVRDGIAWIIHVGDVRAYLFREGALLPLTLDHTLANDAKLLGQSAEDELSFEHYRHIITRGVGFASQGLDPTVNAVALVPGDRLLLCSDGLHDVLDDATIADILTREDEHEGVPALLEACLETLAEDNIALIVTSPDIDPRPEASLDWGELRSSLHERTERGWKAGICHALALTGAEDEARALEYIRGAAIAWPHHIARPAPLDLLVRRGRPELLALCDAIELPEKTSLRDWQWRYVLDHIDLIRWVRVGATPCSHEDLQTTLRLSAAIHTELRERLA